MEIITLSSDDEQVTTSPPKKNHSWVSPNKRYPKGFRFFLPPLHDEGDKSEKISDKGTLKFSY